MGSLSFANPAYLWGALAIGLPILIHLFSRRRPRPLPFGAIELVLRSQRQKRRNLRLRHFLLLLLRCLLIAGIALALARPSLQPKTGVAAAPSGPRATALVLDASLSMRYRLGGKTLFEKAREEALTALDHLSAEEPATVGLCFGPGGFSEGSLAAPSFDRAAARRLLQSAQPSNVASDMTACLDGAAHALGESVLAGKRIFAFTDMSGHAFRLDAPPPLVPANPAAGDKAQAVRPEVVLVDAAEGAELPNAAVLSVATSAAPRLGPRGYEIAATIGNFGNSPLSNLEVELRLGDHPLAKGFVDVPAHETAKKVLGAVLPAGLAVGEIAISHQDAHGLDEDDARPFVIQVPRDLKALIIDGAPSALRERDEAWFVEAALNPARTGGRIAAQTLDQDAAEEKPLEGIDVALLLNPSPPKKIFAERLRAFVQKGGGLFIALGDHADPDALNESLAGLLPRPLHLIKTARDPLAPDDQPGLPPPARFGLIDWQDPIFRIFGPADHEALESVQVDRYALLAAEGPLPMHVLASYDDGAPALVESPVGQGRVLLFTSSASSAWNDWPLHPSFLPVVQQAVNQLAGALEERSSLPSQVGEPRNLTPPAGMQIAQVLGPDHKPLKLSRERAPAPASTDKTVGTQTNSIDTQTNSVGTQTNPSGGSSGAAQGETVSVPVPSPGVYRVLLSAAGSTAGEPHDEPTLAFAAGLDAKESDLRRVDEAELKALLGGSGSAQVAASAKEAQGNRGTPLWPALLLLGVLALLGEGLLTRR